MKEKTKTVLYLNVIVFVLVASLVIRTRQLREAFQITTLGTLVQSSTAQTMTQNAPTVRCIGPDGLSQCRFVDLVGSTKETLVIRERTNSPSQYALCPKTADGKQTTYDSSTASCIPPSDSVDKFPYMPDMSKITCLKSDETFIPSIKRCATIAGTLPRCLPGNPTVESEEVKKAMACYAERYFDNPAVSKLGKDTTLLWEDWTTLGVLNIRNPCCDAESEPSPPGYINIGGTPIEKDWRLWTGVGVGIVVILILLSWILG